MPSSFDDTCNKINRLLESFEIMDKNGYLSYAKIAQGELILIYTHGAEVYVPKDVDLVQFFSNTFCSPIKTTITLAELLYTQNTYNTL